MNKNLCLNTLRSIYIELSNICNYSDIHKRCPLHLVKDKTTISSELVHKILLELSEIDYKYKIQFHNYNEPLIDPRLFHFIQKTKYLLPKATVRILTNGFYLTQEVIRDLLLAGTSEITVSLYNEKEKSRISNLNFLGLKYSFWDISKNGLDDRLNIYTKEDMNCQKSCYSLTTELIIRTNGDICLCCLDYDSRHTFGNLTKNSIEECLQKEKTKKVKHDLLAGRRTLDICRHCNLSRGKPIEEVHQNENNFCIAGQNCSAASLC